MQRKQLKASIAPKEHKQMNKQNLKVTRNILFDYVCLPVRGSRSDLGSTAISDRTRSAFSFGALIEIQLTGARTTIVAKAKAY